MKPILLFSLAILLLAACQLIEQDSPAEVNPSTEVRSEGVSLQHYEAEQVVQVFVDGQPFTAYRYDPAIKKPVLFPIHAANGTAVTRGYPLEPQAGEQADHLHHVGHWLNHGVVNQVDFWASTAETQSTADKVYGAIVHRNFETLEEGDKGELAYVADWISDEEDSLLVENTRFIFSGEDNFRTIDRITILTAKEEPVTFEDSKEGMMAVRVARFMEQPYDQPQEIIGENGRITQEEIIDNTAVNGLFYSSEGLEGDAVWGSRDKWVMMASDQDSMYYSITIMDHPDNVNYPTHWMARGYGLFAANPLGSAAYTEGREQLNFQLAPTESVTFTYRILIHQGDKLNTAELNQIYEEFRQTSF
ncbi:DUF6807 domain-containing protein [Catalinimonas niigatensis]|uniref:DUF6807 domain-containing protein n=1 Tax=Catalinimonas niigatensis TaxID=1397264 RepID=UPI0026664E76|nr:PmoA family protein [Catalinimonas niigatensis]WPP51216.1 PmoA family protein [Catalinimonas niigatensis]